MFSGGTGVGTHLGKFTFQGVECVSIATGIFDDGRWTGVAANGDQLHMNYKGQLRPDWTGAEEEVYVGGTGRFEDATGASIGELKISPAFDPMGNPLFPWPLEIVSVGHISY